MANINEVVGRDGRQPERLAIVEAPNLVAAAAAVDEIATQVGEDLYLTDQEGTIVSFASPKAAQASRSPVVQAAMGRGVSDRKWEELFGHTNFQGDGDNKPL